MKFLGFPKKFSRARGQLIVYPSVQLLIQFHTFSIGALGILSAKFFALSEQISEIDLPLFGAVPTSYLQWIPITAMGASLAYGLVLTNKIVGPIRKIQKRLDDAANGNPVEPIKCRQGDFFPELVVSANAVLEKLDESQKTFKRTGTSQDS